MIFVCERCKFLFERIEEPEKCPDCGKISVRQANKDEQNEYLEKKQGHKS